MQRDDGLQLVDSLLWKPILTQFLVDLLQANLVEFVNGHSDVDYLVGLTDDLGDTGENLAVVNLDADAHAEPREYGIDNLHQFNLIEQ